MDGTDTGTQFEFSFAEGTSWEQIVGFQMAGEIWSSYLKDDVAVRIHVETTDLLPENVIGGALPGKKKDIDYDKFKEELYEDITSNDDLLAFENLVSGKKEFSALVDGAEINKTKKLKLTNANAKAVGILNNKSDKLDGYIVMNDLTGQNAVSWNYDYLNSNVNNIAADKLDFLSVAIHEVGHILGFASGVDNKEWLSIVSKSQTEEKGDIKDDAMKFATPLDLFRYSGEASGFGQLDFSVGGNPYFSIDGGQTNLGEFSTGEETDLGGDGYQASHWKDQDNPMGIMNPTLRPGQVNNISELDVKAMDVIGWDTQEQVNLDWQTIYQKAVAKVDTVSIGDHTKDIEKMLKDSEEYEGRRSRGSGSVNNSWQVGLWQEIQFQKLDLSSLDGEGKLSELDSESPDSEVTDIDTPIDTKNSIVSDFLGKRDFISRDRNSRNVFHDYNSNRALRDLVRGEELRDRIYRDDFQDSDQPRNIDFKTHHISRKPFFKYKKRVVNDDNYQSNSILSENLIPSHLKIPNEDQSLL